jgi:hypothetical protein
LTPIAIHAILIAENLTARTQKFGPFLLWPSLSRPGAVSTFFELNIQVNRQSPVSCSPGAAPFAV